MVDPGLLGSGIFAPDPTAGFPPGATEESTTSGLLHLTFGAFQFAGLAAACFSAAAWIRRRGDASAGFSRACGVTIMLGFAGGAALAQSPVGVALLWVAVVVCYGWLAAMSVYLWKTVPHPDAHRR